MLLLSLMGINLLEILNFKVVFTCSFIRNIHILRLYLCVILLEMNFDYITYQHIPRRMNVLTDAVANTVLDRNLCNM